MDTATWNSLMDRVVREAGDYNPGGVMAPGGGREGDSPIGFRYADLGPLAFVLNEAVDATVNTGVDRDALYEQISENAGDQFDVSDVEDVLQDDVTCPPMELLQAFADACAIDVGIVIDAAQRGGCKYAASPTFPPGY